MPLHSAYAASKHAVAGFLDALRIELMNEGAPVSVTNIMPASINTPLFNNARSKMGVKGQGMAPIYDPQIVADAILQAAEKPVRELIVGGSGRMMISGQKYAPGLMDFVLSKVGFNSQKTKEPKPGTAPDNLFQPSPDDRVEGDKTRQSKSVSAYTFVETRPVASALIAAGALGSATLLFMNLRNRANAGQGDANRADGELKNESPISTPPAISADDLLADDFGEVVIIEEVSFTRK